MLIRKPRPGKSALRRAFTLIELLIVIVIIAVLAAIVIPKFSDQSRRSKESSMKADLHLLRNAAATFQADTGLYPASLGDLSVTTAPANGLDGAGASKAINASDFHGPYISGVLPNDPVSGAAFTYQTANAAGPPATKVGGVVSSATGNDLAGNPYSGY